MPEHLTLSHDSTPQPSPTVRDVLMVLFRHRRLVEWSFLIVFFLVIAYAMATPRYEASMRVLVRRGRFDPPMMPQPSSQADFSRAAVSEEEVNSEVELLRDDEVLRRVAEKNGLVRPGLLASLHVQQEDLHAQVERASRKLAAQIIVEPIRKTSLIQVHYRSSDPAQAARVLNSLATEYSAKHAELHRPSGELEFFDQQISNSRLRLDEAEAALLQFTQREGLRCRPTRT
jgi:uncharacterized protein involved in exopolysaccharide biosynthesis